MSFSRASRLAPVARGFSAAVSHSHGSRPYACPARTPTAQGLNSARTGRTRPDHGKRDVRSAGVVVTWRLPRRPDNVDQQTLLDEMTGTAVDVNANQHTNTLAPEGCRVHL